MMKLNFVQKIMVGVSCMVLLCGFDSHAQEHTEVMMCTAQELVKVADDEVRVYSTMTDENGNNYSFWQWVATNQYRVGVTYEVTFDEKGNFKNIHETMW